jgi:hypothetical protein
MRQSDDSAAGLGVLEAGSQALQADASSMASVRLAQLPRRIAKRSDYFRTCTCSVAGWAA